MFETLGWVRDLFNRHFKNVEQIYGHWMFCFIIIIIFNVYIVPLMPRCDDLGLVVPKIVTKSDESFLHKSKKFDSPS